MPNAEREKSRARQTSVYRCGSLGRACYRIAKVKSRCSCGRVRITV
jgi:hypothetical protein